MTRWMILLALLFVPSVAMHVQTDSIAGTWLLTGADKILPDGTRIADYGMNPHGLVVFTKDGHYMVEIYRADRARFSSDDKTKVTADEYKQAALGMSVHFGTYMLDSAKGTISFHVDRASNPNWDDTTQVRAYTLRGDELEWKVAARPDGSIPVTVLRRAQKAE
ncbi:MAG: lipocalin-like domain-containing protein [Edaphobacter sp.]|uniref:lipocalin-like domain-containing protein n=1 Tax=Edaphobacter sp. TaxID=1934404 RepID=UPI00239ECA22|nr:lipocalin-like domain-containing protein [Edaphobacter sp.]MDE1175901.1 lipocalin-like domain-containing protein [Edaphobacter sp.]